MKSLKMAIKKLKKQRCEIENLYSTVENSHFIKRQGKTQSVNVVACFLFYSMLSAYCQKNQNKKKKFN